MYQKFAFIAMSSTNKVDQVPSLMLCLKGNNVVLTLKNFISVWFNSLKANFFIAFIQKTEISVLGMITLQQRVKLKYVRHFCFELIYEIFCFQNIKLYLSAWKLTTDDLTHFLGFLVLNHYPKLNTCKCVHRWIGFLSNHKKTVTSHFL